jgi:hypothetical protein
MRLAALTCAKWMAPCGLTRFPGELSPMKLADLSAVVPNRNTGLADADGGQGWGRGIPHVMKRKEEPWLIRGLD